MKASDKHPIVRQVLEEKVVAIIRLTKAHALEETAHALREGGLSIMEITLGTPNVYSQISKIAMHSETIVGAGSVIDASGARAAIDAGAKFLVTPVTKKEICTEAVRHNVPVFSGAFTPGEILHAYELGAALVKLFPAEPAGLPYFKAVRSPLPQIPLMPTGGIRIDNAAFYLAAGAVALGVGSALVDEETLWNKDYETIRKRAIGFSKIIRDFRTSG